MRGPGRPRKGQHATGPYYEGDADTWRVVFCAADGSRTSTRYQKEGVAIAARDEFNAASAAAGQTLGQALEAYREYYLTDRGNKETSWLETERRILALHGGDKELELDMVTPARAAKMYRDYSASGVSVDSHRGALGYAKTFYRWARKRGLVMSNPFDDVEGIGRKRKGKDQLRQDEAERWLKVALRLARGGEWRATMAAMTLLMGCRASEILHRQVRDVDAGCTVLVIPEAKTQAGRRTLEIPDVLRPMLRAHCKGRRGTELLFGQHCRGFVTSWVKEICRLAKIRPVCAHSMRGLWGSVQWSQGADPNLVARHLGHASPQVTAQHYATRQAQDAARSKRAGETLKVIAGGKR